MKQFLGVLVATCAMGLVACGDKDSGPAGTWVLDANGTFEANRAALMRDVDAGLDQAKAGMEQLNREMEKIPEAQRAQMMQTARDQMFAAAGEHRDLMEAFLRSPEEARKLGEQKAKKQLDGMTLQVTVKSDNTYTSTASMGPSKEEGSGTWSQSGDQVTFQPKQKDGKAASGDDAKPRVMTLKGGTLSGKPDANAPTFILKRK